MPSHNSRSTKASSSSNSTWAAAPAHHSSTGLSCRYQATLTTNWGSAASSVEDRSSAMAAKKAQRSQRGTGERR